MIDQAIASGARQAVACKEMGICTKTYRAWKKTTDFIDKRTQRQFTPKNKITETEQKKILSIVNSPEYCDRTPNEIVPILAENGTYIASESTFYRVLRQHNQLTHRHKSQPKKHHKPKALHAFAPNQVFSWDISYLPTTVDGLFYYLYFVMDIYSRKIVGYAVHETQSADLAATLMETICHEQNIRHDQVTLHSDNGAPMKGATLLITLNKLGIATSFSRPSVSNDNAYSEALFKTTKYHPSYPKSPFISLEQARAWVDNFVTWYNTQHRHSKIKFVTPEQRHLGLDKQILAKRNIVYLNAKSKNPNRWSKNTRNWKYIDNVILNDDKKIATS